MLELDKNMTSRMKIWLETGSDILKFVHLAERCPKEMLLNIIDGKGMCVSARSFLGVTYAREFKHMWLVSNSDKIHTLFDSFAKE